MRKPRFDRPNKTGRNENPKERFVQLPHRLLFSQAYRSLTPNARGLLVELISMHNGSNNGSLYLSVRDAAARLGLNNTDSASHAFTNLMTTGFIRMTADSHFSVKAKDSSRARCWRLTFCHADKKAATNEWETFIPANEKERKRSDAGLRALSRYRKALSSEKYPVAERLTNSSDHL